MSSILNLIAELDERRQSFETQIEAHGDLTGCNSRYHRMLANAYPLLSRALRAALRLAARAERAKGNPLLLHAANEKNCGVCADLVEIAAINTELAKRATEP